MSINLVGGENSTYSLIKQGIKASTARAKVISNNIANINTKGYKRFSVVFEENINGSGQTDLQIYYNLLVYNLLLDHLYPLILTHLIKLSPQSS